MGISSTIVTAITFIRGYSSRDQLLFILSFFIVLVTLSLNGILQSFPDNLVLLSLIVFSLFTPRAVNSSRPSSIGKWGTAALKWGAIFPMLFLFSPVLYLREIPSLIYLGISLSLTAIILITSKGKSKLSLAPKYLKIALPTIALLSIPLVISVDIYGEHWFPKEVSSGYYVFPIVFTIVNTLFFSDSLTQLIQKPKDECEIILSFDLTNREREVAEKLLDGKSYAQIGQSLNISLSTVKTHCSNIYFKLKISNRYELFRIVSESVSIPKFQTK